MLEEFDACGMSQLAEGFAPWAFPNEEIEAAKTLNSARDLTKMPF
jgi:hypothetical protein